MNKKKELLSIFNMCLLVSFAAAIMALFRVYNSKSIGSIIYIWNLMLAWIPFTCSIIISYIYFSNKNYKKNSIILYLLMFIWFIFYPNAPYIITDYIHINVSNYVFKIKDTLEFSKNFWIWYDFILISLFAWIGFILGFISLYLNQIIISIKYNKIVSWIFVTIVLFVSGYGIYLGRFIRFNSWDIITNPFGLIIHILKDISFESLCFSIVFGVFLLLTYILLHKVANIKIGNTK